MCRAASWESTSEGIGSRGCACICSNDGLAFWHGCEALTVRCKPSRQDGRAASRSRWVASARPAGLPAGDTQNSSSCLSQSDGARFSPKSASRLMLCARACGRIVGSTDATGSGRPRRPFEKARGLFQACGNGGRLLAACATLRGAFFTRSLNGCSPGAQRRRVYGNARPAAKPSQLFFFPRPRRVAKDRARTRCWSRKEPWSRCPLEPRVLVSFAGLALVPRASCRQRGRAGRRDTSFRPSR